MEFDWSMVIERLPFGSELWGWGWCSGLFARKAWFMAVAYIINKPLFGGLLSLVYQK